MTTAKTVGVLAAALLSSVVATSAFADTMTMWVRASGANAAAHLVDLWNTTHPDKIELTTIPDNQMVTKLATGVQAAETPDLVSFDLIYMPDFMKAGFLVDLTADLKANPNFASVAKAYIDIATYEGKHGEIALGHYCRQSLVEHMDTDELLKLTEHRRRFRQSECEVATTLAMLSPLSRQASVRMFVHKATRCEKSLEYARPRG